MNKVESLWFDKLNKQQYEAVSKTEGPILVQAGAGTGKTRVITTKILYLMLYKKVDPTQICAITFTNRARKEMEDRLKATIDFSSPSEIPCIKTFHGLCLKILRAEQGWSNVYNRNFTILEPRQGLAMIRNAIKAQAGTSVQLDYDFVKKKAQDIQKLINLLKKRGFSAYDEKEQARFFIEDMNLMPIALFDKYFPFYKMYEDYKAQNNMLDFNDLIFLTLRFFNNNEQARTKWANRFQYLLVDEFQDTFPQAFDLLLLLAGQGQQNITVVGDPNQAIFEWNGANPRFMLDFQQYFKNAQTVRLQKNYRSTTEILNFSNFVLQEDSALSKNNLESFSGKGPKPFIIKAYDNDEEAFKIVQKILALKKEDPKLTLNDFMIIYRLNYQSFPFEKVLTNCKIPFRIVGNAPFLGRKDVIDMQFLLHLFNNPTDHYWERVLLLVPQIGPVSWSKMKSTSKEANITIHQLITKSLSLLKPDMQLKLKNTHEVFLQAQQELHNASSLKEWLPFLHDWAYIKANINNEHSNIRTFFEVLCEEEDLLSEEDQKLALQERLHLCLNNLMLEAPSVQKKEGDQITKNSNVILSSIHKAKGTEAQVIFVTGLCDGKFPFHRSNGMEDITGRPYKAEEARIFYVAITRAKKYLFLSYYMTDKWKSYDISPFIADQPKIAQYCNYPESALDKIHQAGLTHKTGLKLAPQDKVNHTLYGIGKVVALYGNFVDITWEKNSSKKMLSLRDPNLQKIS